MKNTLFIALKFQNIEEITMKVRRKFNLARIGHQYESIDIEVEGENIEDIIQEIEQAWRDYCKAIVEEKVQ